MNLPPKDKEEESSELSDAPGNLNFGNALAFLQAEAAMYDPPPTAVVPPGIISIREKPTDRPPEK